MIQIVFTIVLGFWGTSTKGFSDTIDLQVKVTNVNEAKGSILIALYNSEDAWMEGPRAVVSLAKPAKKGMVSFDFTGLKKGSYGYAVFHDANDNKELDMQWFPPKPAEGVGTSNNATGTFGPPNWDDSKFSLIEKSTHTIKMQYL